MGLGLNCLVIEFLLSVAETSRESDWDGIAACHQATPLVTTWNYQKSTMGKHKLRHDRFRGVHGVHATVSGVNSLLATFQVWWWLYSRLLL